ncbi:DNA-directed RNA polymerase subunit delta [Salinibacillus kushneri]|uniref:Probable DNA-directed RNA polymerase subunit delta n=1 Tax=Salinibacillus kushneri TaxID=237682 RepID=A0A1I0CUG8_9BACI|nr:DNA-directed RNA polymerase subunit delta [Salinibacillus kushneri]SET23388.1 DNA-directed RNA polymerase subunit delta [Salinibacillus kushneri]
MGFEKYTQEELEELSMLDVAIEILAEEKKAMDFNELYNLVSEAKGFSTEQKEENISQFYAELNIDGRFLTVGSNMWGAKRWYPVDQIDDDVKTGSKKKKKKKAAKKEKKELPEEHAEDELADELEDDLNDDHLDEALDEDLDEDYDLEDNESQSTPDTNYDDEEEE